MKTYLNRLLGYIPALFVGLACLSAVGESHAVETITYFHNDIAGSPLLATDAAGAVLWKENYRPYGDKLNNPPASADNKLGFTGKPYDANTGLSYMGARYYDPVIGRFTGNDPVDFDERNLHSFNRYAYANNNPYKFVDPDGRSAVHAVKITFGVSFAVATRLGAGVAGAWIADKLWNVLHSEEKGTESESPGTGKGSKGAEPGSETTSGDDQGCIYCVKGEKTSSGKDYVGSTDNLGQRQKDKSDGRDREGSEVIGTYPKGDRDARRAKEQQAINDRGGVERLDNKRNEVAPKKWPNMGIAPP